MPIFGKAPLLVVLLVSLGFQLPRAHAQSGAAPRATAAVAGTTDEDPAAVKKSAQAALQSKDWGQALKLWDSYLALKPEDAYGDRMRGWTLHKLQRGDDAIAAYRRSTALAPKDANAWNGLCWIQILLDKPQDAQVDCEKTVALVPSDYAALVNLGHTYLLQGDAKTAQDWYQRSLLNISSESDLKDGPLADFDIFIGNGWQVASSQQAKAWFEKEGAAWLARLEPVNQLLAQATAAEKEKDYARSVALREQRLPILIALVGQDHQRVKEARTALIDPLDHLANQLFAQARYSEALPLYQQVLAFREQENGLETIQTGVSLNDVARTLEKMGRYAEALPFYARALAISEKTNGPDHPHTGTYLNNLALLYQSMGRFAEALPFYDRALAISEKANGPHHPDTGVRLNNLALLYQSMGRYAEALPLSVHALEISEKANGPDHPDTGVRLNNLAWLYRSVGRDAEALPLVVRALPISEKANGPDHPTTGASLSILALLYQSMGRYAEALPLSVRALAISKKANGPDHADTGIRLSNLAAQYGFMGRYAEALPLSVRALAISEKANGPDHPTTGISLNNLALLYQSMGRYAEALPLSVRALAISEKVNGPDHPTTGTRLNNLAWLYQSMGRYAEALPLSVRALAISEKANGTDHPATGISLNNLAWLYQSMGQPAQAEPLYERAWRIASNAGVPELAWTAQGNLLAFYAATKPDLAIWYGKQAVNTLQQVRSGNSALDKETQKSFLEKNESTYKSLADLLFSQGRLLEGQQVLAMLKEAEYFDFVQRSSTADPRKTQADYTEQERPWSERYSAISSQLAAMSKEREALIKMAKEVGSSFGGSGKGAVESLSVDDQKRKDRLDADLAVARQAYDAFMVDLKREFTQGASAQRQQEFGEKNIASLRALQGTLRDLSKLGNSGTVILHYLMTDKRLWILLTTSTVQLKREAAISEADLNRQIGQYRQAIAGRDPKVKELGKALYDLLIAPVADDLKQAQAQTLMLSLDGSLRYLPMAALYDGEKYLAQRYRLSLYTSAAKDKLKDLPQTTWTLAGYGLTQKIENFAALPSVKGELNGILQDMKGSIKLDNDFTATAFKTGLEGEPPVVHLASHFVFKPGNETDSFLLMGDGKKLSLKEIKDGYEFINLDLLTLSACETAVGGGKDANGREVEGFGALAQNQGAKGVIATLWPVADQSTGQFMQLFYGFRQQNPGMTKVQAMQMAQQAFIEGRVGAALAQVSRSAKPVGDGNTTATAVITTDHPYYWAPFILMGNWL